MVARLLWEQEAEIRGAMSGKSEMPWDTWGNDVFPPAGSLAKTGVDHMFDHRWKN